MFQNRLSRATASAINQAAPDKATSVLTLAGFDQPVPVVFGEDRITGLWLVRPYVKDVSGIDHLRFALLWSWGECEGAQAVYLNAQTVAAGHMTHYTGTDAQTADPKLSADIAGFNDAYKGWAYTVFDIPAATYDGFPQTIQIECVFRGRKVYDERTATTAWSENPGLCFADWISDSRYGPGFSVIGAGDVADRCDELVGGVEVRSRMGLSLRKPLSLQATLALFSAYAECLYSYDSSSVLLVPDAPVEAPAATLTTADYEDGSLRFRGEPLDNVPTEVTVSFRESSGSAVQWPEASETVSLAGVDTGDVAAVRSEPQMPGIRRSSEARRKGLMRLRRLQHPGRITWRHFDDGVKLERGDVVRLPDTQGLSTRDVRVMDIDMISPGLYQVEAEPYTNTMYPDDYEPGDTTAVPVNGILPYIGTDTPAGYEDFTAANGRFLVGAGSTFARGATFGSTEFTVSGTTSEEPAHNGSTIPFPTVRNATSGTFSMYRDVSDSSGPHLHNYSVAQNRTPLYAQSKLIKKTGTPGDVPANGGVFADGELITTAYEALTTLLGRMNRAGPSVGSGGSQLNYNLDVGIQTAGGHIHVSDVFGYDYAVDFTNEMWSLVDTNRGAHAHGSSIPVVMSIPRIKLAHYVASSGFEIVPGAIIGYDGDGALPSGWYDCDGLNGTPDTRNFWPERSAPGDAGVTIAGTRKVTWSGNTLFGGQHNHKGTKTIENRQTRNASHDDGFSHSHSLSGEIAYDPPSYAMRFIQYTGVV